MTRFAASLTLLLLLVSPVSAKDAKVKPPHPKEVHAAITRGIAWLEARFDKGFPKDSWHSPVELTALTYIHARADRKSKVFRAALKEMETCKLQHTYRVATLAMTLSEINPFLYRARLAHCAQWLADTQCPGGEWGYPGVMAGRTDSTIPTEVKPPEVPDNVKERIVIVPRTSTSVSEGEPVRTGDFSNTQYAVLGLRACAQAHIDIPKETWKRALGYMKKFQHEDGGWGYVRQGEQDQSPYASLTCAGVCGASVCLYQLGKKNPKTDPIVSKALKWLKEHWDATQNTWADMSSVILPSTWQYYHLYSVERVGSVLGLKKIGSRKWYPEGARWVLDQQKSDGSWDDPGSDIERPNYLQTADTCFAILFLARATPPLTGG